jgi:pseudaminic acid biosynthesis-associated methylase
MSMNEQETFWRERFAAGYRERNAEFDYDLGVRGWREMLRKADRIERVLECGSNVGRNIDFLQPCLPAAAKSIIEISPDAFRIVSERQQLEHAFNGSIVASDLPKNHFDLVFTCGVLIHIHPDDLAANMQKMFEYSRRYVLIGEYFNRTPVSLEYHGEANKLFKRDFGRFFLERFPVDVVDYGFLWGHVYERAGFDDITWWLFQKRS